MRAGFLGVTSVLLDDGDTRLLTDGFFSRPALHRVLLGRLAPDATQVEQGLARAGVTDLKAVLVGHSHYDHALDAPEVARRSGALVVGSSSTANLARGYGLPEAQIRVVMPGEPLVFGAFRVTFYPSRHVLPNAAAGEITAPLKFPARARAFRDGGCFSLLIEHESGKNLLIQESAGFVRGALSGIRAEIAMISIAMLSRHPDSYRRAYFSETAGAVGAKVIYPLHYDDFFRPLELLPRPMPRWMDDIRPVLDSLERWAGERGVRVGWLPAWQMVPLD
ncbi:predicted Zn-dependent hydrolases of the beta-lactamase fold [Anaerolinea thermolimosa]|nr:predicted Zn-dependent hydrolases of the beta-lactamase fold [Anaerolinea thermolimosa]